MTGRFDPNAGRVRRIKALIRKETLQTLRDPSSLIVAVVLPAILLFLYGYGVSFDVTRVRVGLVIENPSPETERLANHFQTHPSLPFRSAQTGAPF